MSYDDVRTLVAEANRVLAEFGLSSGAVAGHGHVSMRVPDAPDHSSSKVAAPRWTCWRARSRMR